jgi:hypothetical protein
MLGPLLVFRLQISSEDISLDGTNAVAQLRRWGCPTIRYRLGLNKRADSFDRPRPFSTGEPLASLLLKVADYLPQNRLTPSGSASLHSTSTPQSLTTFARWPIAPLSFRSAI